MILYYGVIWFYSFLQNIIFGVGSGSSSTDNTNQMHPNDFCQLDQNSYLPVCEDFAAAEEDINEGNDNGDVRDC